VCHEYCVPVLAAALQATRPHLRVLDFGGSVGFLFYPLVGALARPDDLELHVVDNASICRAGRELFAGEPRITFHSELPGGPFDLVHLGSSIQYVNDWAWLVRELVVSTPEFLVFDDVPAGDIETFVSLQNYYGQQIPHWFFDVREFVATVTRVTGYRLFYTARYVGTFLGKTGTFPMEKFPKERRIDNAYNLAFCRSRGTTDENSRR
jgi:putative methyltransferase (TIGR04325 family)